MDSDFSVLDGFDSDEIIAMSLGSYAHVCDDILREDPSAFPKYVIPFS